MELRAELESSRKQKRAKESMASHSKVSKLADRSSEIIKLNLLDLSDHHRQVARTLLKEETRLKVCSLY